MEGRGRGYIPVVLIWAFVVKHTAPNQEVRKNNVAKSCGRRRGERNRAESERQEVTQGEKERLR